MVLTGDVTIYAPRKKLWDFPTDPDLIGQCASGVGKVVTSYRGLGFVKARCSGEVDILKMDEFNKAKLTPKDN
jgi:carbon monoxide dehydrogenase subunit G